MILIDTGPLVAFFDASDRYHGACLDLLKQVREPLLTIWPVVTETLYLLGFSWKAQENFWKFLLRGGVEIVPQDSSALDRCFQLMLKYRDLPMDLADAALVVLAEATGIRRIFTLDHKDFRVYRSSHARHFDLLPKEL